MPLIYNEVTKRAIMSANIWLWHFVHKKWMTCWQKQQASTICQSREQRGIGGGEGLNPTPPPPPPPPSNDYEGQNIPWQIGLRSCLPSLPDLPGVSQYKQWSPCLTILVYFLLVYTEPLFFLCLRSHFKIKIVHFLCRHIKILREVVT